MGRVGQGTVIVVAGLLFYFLFIFESDADRREKECKQARVDAAALQECRQSEAARARVLAAKRDAMRASLVTRYNSALADLAQAPKSSVHPTGYTLTSVGELSKDTGMTTFGFNTETDASHPALGRKYKLRGTIHAHMLPKELSLSTDTTYIVGEVGNPLVGVPLDIESLNRVERAFIKDNCDFPVPGCTATLFATVGVLPAVGRIEQIGLVANRVDFEPAAK